MNFNQYWTKLTKSNKSLSNPDTEMKISVASFKKQLEKAFKAGRAKTTAQAAKEFEDLGKKPNVTDSFDDMFKGIFG